MDHSLSRSTKFYLVITALFSVLLVLTNILGIKYIQAPFVPSLALSASILVYPLTFFLTDLVTEIWNLKRAQLMVILGFAFSLLAVFIVHLVQLWPAHPYWAAPENPFGYTTANEYQTAFDSVFSINGKILLGSMIAYLISQFIDAHLFQFIRKLTGEKWLWLRSNAATMVAQLFDTVIVNAIVLYWGLHLDWDVGIEIMKASYLYKLIITILCTPFFYIVVFALKNYLKKPAVDSPAL